MRKERDPQYYERQYNARLAVPDHPQIFTRWIENSETARSTLSCRLDVQYGDKPTQAMDVFMPQGESRALLMFVHGGYWRSLDKGDFSFIAPGLTAAGITVACINYTLVPQISLEELTMEVVKATAWLYRNAQQFNADPNRLFVSGHSAGGQQTGMLLATDWPRYSADLPRDVVKGAVSVSGIFDLEPLIHTSMNEVLKLDLTRARRNSPIAYSPATNAPMVLSVGGGETDAFKKQNTALKTAWQDHNFIDVPMPGSNHFTVIEQLGKPASPLFRATLRMMGLEVPAK